MASTNHCSFMDKEVFGELSLLKSAADQTSNIILITDADMEEGPKIVYANPSFERVTGYSASEIIGKTPKILQGPETNYELMNELRETISRGGEFQGSTVNYKKSGEPYDVEWHISPVRDEKGKVTHFVSVQEDVTIRNMQQKLLKKYTEKLEDEVKIRTQEAIQSEKMAAIGILVAGVAHEINNPVSYIKSNLEFVSEDLKALQIIDDDSKRRDTIANMLKMVQSCMDGTKRIADITTTLKRFAKPDDGGMAPSNVNQGIEDTLVIVNNKLKNRITVHKELGNLPPIECNIGQMNQVFLNMIINASQAMEEGDLWIRTRVSGSEVFIEFEDNGIGITEKDIEKIFDAFYTTKEMGTGLGLSVSYKIVERHGGRISVESKPGKGTRFTITIPKR